MTPEYTAWEILRTVAGLAGLSREEMLGKRRYRPIARARQVTCALIHEFRPALSREQIGRIIHKDRTTVTYALNVLPTVMRRESKTKALYDDAKRELGQ